jgi:CubicO group peptidase (beta-lactamase class C family)
MRSISKSVTSLLLGIALDRKLIMGIDTPVIEFFPEYAVTKPAGWDKITLRHLVTMSSGLEWNENLPWNPMNDEWHLANDYNPLHYVLQRPVALPPGTVWNYNGGGTELLGSIIAKVSGKPFDVFAREALFEPLGIHDWEWKTWHNGMISRAAGLRLRPRDAAKLGQLVLNKGSWNGRRIVSPDWISESIKPRFQAIGYFGGLFFYGYHWWMGRTLAGEGEVKWIAAVGKGGQRLFVVPELDLVVMTTSGLYASPQQGHAALDILYSFVVPAIRAGASAR